eukprot:scaffold101793_cov61-Attheya_sp.AAC.2
MIDPNMVIKSTIDGTLWSIPNEIPMFDRHQQYFPVHQTSPPRQAKKVTVHFELQMTRTISHLKHTSNPQTQKIATIRRITEVYPCLTCAPELIKNLTSTAMKELIMPAADITWHTQTQVIEIEPDENAVPVPLFNLVPRNCRWGNGKGRIKTMMMNIECAASDTPYLKALLSESCHQETFECGQFIPEGIHLMTNVKTLKVLVSAENKYLEKS